MEQEGDLPRLSPIVFIAIWALFGPFGLLFLGLGVLTLVRGEVTTGALASTAAGIGLLAAGYGVVRLLKKSTGIFTPPTSTGSPRTSVSYQRLSKSLVKLVVAALCIYGVVWNFSGAFTKPASKLEKVTVLGASSHQDFEQFRDEGGLNSSPAWHGLYVNAIELQYLAPGSKLNAFTLSVDARAKWLSGIDRWTRGETISSKEVRSALTSVCGGSEDEWKHTDGNLQFGSLETSRARCGYTPERSGFHIIVGLP